MVQLHHLLMVLFNPFLMVVFYVLHALIWLFYVQVVKLKLVGLNMEVFQFQTVHIVMKW